MPLVDKVGRNSEGGLDPTLKTRGRHQGSWRGFGDSVSHAKGGGVEAGVKRGSPQGDVVSRGLGDGRHPMTIGRSERSQLLMLRWKHDDADHPKEMRGKIEQ